MPSNLESIIINLINNIPSQPECNEGDTLNDNPCNPSQCINGTWNELSIDCPEQTGIPCGNGLYLSPSENECCSICTTYGDLNSDSALNVSDVVLTVAYILGTSDARNINDENPFGMNPNDPNGQDDILIQGDDLHLLIDQPVKVLLRSIDVLHNFYVPQFRGKMDMVPGMITYYWFTPEKSGEYEILCAELCGVGHHAMRGFVSVDNESNYNEWLSEQMTFKESMESASLNVNKFAENK